MVLKEKLLLQSIVRRNIFICYSVMRCSFPSSFFFCVCSTGKKEGAEGALCTHNYVCVFFLFLHVHVRKKAAECALLR